VSSTNFSYTQSFTAFGFIFIMSVLKKHRNLPEKEANRGRRPRLASFSGSFPFPPGTLISAPEGVAGRGMGIWHEPELAILRPPPA
ncbi:MAG TPA: hypothetical protein PJ988_20965, partial [Anaerolinea sp.]|nr:hypothetical protein [Anaerolinea sp.]